ncbi:MAG TPA: phytanoyl-CoA dioxygenase family protein [Acidimicrobiales bacterium]|nr:phytanoyl-CoA dioxygenase family protein [Acidimicrobiales bacterium]
MLTEQRRSSTPRPIGFDLGGRSFTYSLEDGAVSVRDGLDGATAVVALTADDWNHLLGQTRTFINLFLAGDLRFVEGDFGAIVDWEPLLKEYHCGTPVYDPGRVDLSDLDLTRTFTLQDSDGEIRDYLSRVGFTHLAGVFTREEMDALDTEVDRLAAMATPDDEMSWWVDDPEGERRLCRLVYAGRRSELIAGFENDERVQRLGRLLRPDLQVVSDRMEGTSVLLKVPGRTTGLSNIPWHQDCGMGGHSIYCPSVAVGIQITGSDASRGNLLVVPGSHGQTLHYDWKDRYPEAPVVAVDTEPGDVTLHIADVMHASPEPTGQGWRRTMYVTFFPPTLWDHVGPGEASNDLIRREGAKASALVRPPAGS